MKNIAAVIILLFFQNIVLSQECKDIHNGEFELIDTELNHHSIIFRNGSIQIEKNLKTGFTTSFTVRWIDDCTYELVFSKTEDSNIKPYLGKKVITKISKIENNKVYFSSRFEDFDKESIFFMFIKNK